MKISELADSVSSQVFRIEFFADNQLYRKILNWMTENKIQGSIKKYPQVSLSGSTIAVDLSGTEVSAFVLKWS
jgi:hypothetical protein